MTLDDIVPRVIFQPGTEVYLKTDPDQYMRIVTEVRLRMNGGIAYEITIGGMSTIHYSGELAIEPTQEDK